MISHRTQPLFETLETRQMMTAVTYTGTPGADVFMIDNVAADYQITIDGKGGADVVQLGAAGGTVKNILGTVTIKNPDGQVFVLMNDADRLTIAEHLDRKRSRSEPLH